MDNVKVSIIIPVYNVEQYLRQCLDSVVNQTLKDIEIICIDDGSSDSSLEILHEYSSKDSRIKIITQQHEGAGAARNKGLAVANGKYLSFLDSDDFFETDMLEQLYNCSEKYNTDIVICKSNTFDNGNIKEQNNIKDKLLPNKEVFSSLDIPKYAFQFHMGWCWDKLYKTSFIKEKGICFQNIRRHNDAFFAHISMINAERIYVLNKRLVYYRKNRNASITQANIKKDEYIFLCKDMLKEIKNYLIKNNLFEIFKQSYVNYCMFTVAEHFKLLSFKTQVNFRKIFEIEKCNRKYFYSLKYFRIYIISSYKILILLYNLVSFHKRYF
ncbi:glycosyltransferase family 2 protein [Candidatus Ruminimicrobiellum ovillum]|uniref:glycosyltransferase family 2 protein n=1 Tax=Candidatus Ruminimicrobiellum ovillum TaxID=1947927 RepID=UPI00355AB13A